jgi:ADP-ribose pyrophosphatase YjhB (NUDIX family)
MNITAQTVLINPQGFVLGVSRKDNHQDFGLCGGKMEEIDKGDPQMTAIRETFEETGLKISNLRLVFAMHKDGYMGYTYLADYKGEINHNEPHVVKWVPFEVLTSGSFGKYNQLVGESLKDMGIHFNDKINIDALIPDYKKIVEESGYIFDDLRKTKDWLGMESIELTFKNSDGSYIDEDFYDFNLVKKITILNSMYNVKVRVPSEYFPK